jgi:hypothetical protein
MDVLEAFARHAPCPFWTLHEPIPGVITQVLRPMKPKPAWAAKSKRFKKWTGGLLRGYARKTSTRVFM